jgi:hypothetical protein
MSSHRGLFVSTFAIAVLAAVPALAESFRYPAAGVTFRTPAAWIAKPSDTGMVAADRANDTAVALVAVEDSDIAQAGNAVGRRLAGMIDNIKVTKEERLTVNGMPAVMVDGDGRRGGVDIDWAVMFIKTPSVKNDLMVIAIAEDAKLALHRGEIKSIFTSISPM